MSTPQQTLEQRLRLVEDKLAIYHLIASHPPAADTGNENYYRNAFTPDGTVDLGGGKGASGNEAIGAIVARPEHREAITGGLCHFAGLPRVEIDGDTAVAISYLQIDHAASRRRAHGRAGTRRLDRLSHSPRRRQPLGSGAHRRRLEGQAPRVAAARRLEGRARAVD